MEEVEVCDGGRGGVGMGLDHGGSGEGMKWDGARERGARRDSGRAG